MAQPESTSEDRFLFPATGSSLGDYQLIRELSRGGMGVVYVAQKKGGQRQVALKTIRPDRVDSLEARLRFEREVGVLEKFNHDHIMPIYDFGSVGNVMYMVMPLLPGMTLDQQLRTHPNLPLDEILRIGIECLKGLSVAHSADVIHRDFKPSNVYLEELADRQAQPRVRLLDFGLAKPLGEEQGVTRMAGACGTPGYMSPEQLQGRSVSAKSDLFAFGCTLYKMTTGLLPFAGKSMDAGTSFELYAEQLSDPSVEPTPPITLNPHIPPDLSNLILRLLAKSPSKRPANAEVVMQELLGIASSQACPVSAEALTATRSFVDTAPDPLLPANPTPQEEPAAPNSKRRSIGCTITITLAACIAFVGVSLGAVALVTAPLAKAEREKYEQAIAELKKAQEDLKAQAKLDRELEDEKRALRKRDLDEERKFKQALDLIAANIALSQQEQKRQAQLVREDEQKWAQQKLELEKQLKAQEAANQAALTAAQNRVQTVVVPHRGYWSWHPSYGWGYW